MSVALESKEFLFILEMAAPACPPLKDLPKVAGDLKNELEGFKTTCLKNTDTQEKIILPTAEGMYLCAYTTQLAFLFCRSSCLFAKLAGQATRIDLI